ncbi:MAG: hypothetical protein ACI85O_001511 [Saprospiraceae bacterium]|jgi:hypothetical protein
MLYKYHDFSKADKKLLRDDTLTKCVQAEIRKFMHDTQSKYHEVLTEKHEDLRVPYWELQEKTKAFNKHLTSTYDNHGHPEIPQIIALALLNNVISDKELEGYSEDGIAKIKEVVEWLRAFRS